MTEYEEDFQRALARGDELLNPLKVFGGVSPAGAMQFVQFQMMTDPGDRKALLAFLVATLKTDIADHPLYPIAVKDRRGNIVRTRPGPRDPDPDHALRAILTAPVRFGRGQSAAVSEAGADQIARAA